MAAAVAAVAVAVAVAEVVEDSQEEEAAEAVEAAFPGQEAEEAEASAGKAPPVAAGSPRGHRPGQAPMEAAVGLRRHPMAEGELTGPARLDRPREQDSASPAQLTGHRPGRMACLTVNSPARIMAIRRGKTAKMLRPAGSRTDRITTTITTGTATLHTEEQWRQAWLGLPPDMPPERRSAIPQAQLPAITVCLHIPAFLALRASFLLVRLHITNAAPPGTTRPTLVQGLHTSRWARHLVTEHHKEQEKGSVQFPTFLASGNRNRDMNVSGQSTALRDIGFKMEADNTLVVRIAGTWNISDGLHSVEEFKEKIGATPPSRVSFETTELRAWDGSLLVYLAKLKDYCFKLSISVAGHGLPVGVANLLDLATAVPEKKDARKEKRRIPFLTKIGEATLNAGSSAGEMLSFIGEACIALTRLIRGKARFRRSDLFLLIQECGAQALPIVSLISVLVGLILAFVGAVQLKLFGAQIYVADLVGIGMAREMGAMMTAIVMAGRTGAAFAAQLGTMEVNEEIDALKTLGISPMEFLVLPRMLALVLMLPLLCLYADLMGILGGGLIGVGLLDITPMQYFNETKSALTLMQFVAGLIKAGVFGVLVALAGCLRGIQCGRSASAVGEAATSAVVTAIVSIIVSDALLTVIYDRIGM